ncbi:MAG: 6-hydroxynicotinate reductase [Rhodospirillales bacterium]
MSDAAKSAPPPPATAAGEDAAIVVCDACPVRCRIRLGSAGACDRYANVDGRLARVDPLVVAERIAGREGAMVPFLARDGAADGDWDGTLVGSERRFVTGIGAGTTYPDYKPAPFIVASEHAGVDMVTVVTEGIFSYCGAKVKIDTDRHLGPETATVRRDGDPVGHVTTSEYGSQMLALGGVRHLTGGGKREGVITCDTLLALCNKEAVELTIDGGSRVVVGAGRPPVVDGTAEERMRVGCGSATIGMFAPAWVGQVDDVVVVDDHITGVLSEHEAGRFLGVQPTGIRIEGRKSTPGRYFRVAEPGSGWGGTSVRDPLTILHAFDPRRAKPGLTLLMVSTTGEDAAFFVLDENLAPQPAAMPAALAETVELIRENCEPALCSVLFMAGAGGSLRAGVTRNPVRLTRSVKDSLVWVSAGGAPVFVWPGGGITFMVDVARMPERSFGSVPTPALVAPIEFSMRLADYAALGGHMDRVVRLADIPGAGGAGGDVKAVAWAPGNPWPFAADHFPWGRGR